MAETSATRKIKTEGATPAVNKDNPTTDENLEVSTEIQTDITRDPTVHISKKRKVVNR